MKLIGITGGIGMGKSTAGDVLRKKSVPVSDTDLIARQMVEPGCSALEEIRTELGDRVLDTNGHLQRDELARIVFADAAARQKLEAILHPRIREAWQNEAQRWRAEDHRFGFVIIPLLFETNAAALFDATICVACSAATQMTRLRARGWDEKQIQQRIQSQWPTVRKMDAADYVVWTDTTVEVHAAQIDLVLGRLG